MEKNMKKMIYVLVITFLSLTIYSCAKKSDSSTSSTTTSSTTTEIEGEWKTTCYSSGSYYKTKTITVSGTGIVKKSEYHSDSSCSIDNYTVEYTFSSLSIGDAVEFNSGKTGHKYTMTLSTMTETQLNSYEVSFVNSISWCGYTDWVLDTPKSIAGKTCGTSTEWSENTSIYGLYLLDGSKLFVDTSSSSYPSSVGTGTSDTYNKQ